MNYQDACDRAAAPAVAPPASRAPAVNRAIAILRTLARAKAPMTMNGIARQLGLVPSSCFHLLRALEEEGFVDLDPVDKRYSLGLGLVSLARESLNGDVPTRLLRNATSRIAARFDVTAIATRLDRGDRMVILAVGRGDSPFGIHFDIGRRFPAFVSATGRCFANHAQLSPAALRKKFDELVWSDPPPFATWLAQVEEARRDGVAVDRGNYVRGYTILAAPVLEEGRMTHSLVAIGVGEQLTAAVVAELKDFMLATAQQLSN